MRAATTSRRAPTSSSTPPRAAPSSTPRSRSGRTSRSTSSRPTRPTTSSPRPSPNEEDAVRVTQGTFSYLPDLTDEQLSEQVRYALEHGWSMSVEHTDDPHPRNSYWEMWGLPVFDLQPEEVEVVMRDVRACREAYADEYIKLLAYDSSLGRQTTALSIIV